MFPVSTNAILRSVLAATLGTGCALAATIATQVNCNGLVRTGTTSASCSTDLASASATIGASPFYQDSVGFSIEALGGTENFPPPLTTFSASATFQDDYVLTVTGGSGSGSIWPCMFASWDNYRGSGNAGINFGGSAVSAPGSSTSGGTFGRCEGPPNTPLIPFTFGVPQTITVSMSGFATVGITPSQVGDSVYLRGLQFFDTAGNPLADVHFTLVSTAVPEPSTLALLFGGLCLIVSARRYRR
jgi:hypothetical protein